MGRWDRSCLGKMVVSWRLSWRLPLLFAIMLISLPEDIGGAGEGGAEIFLEGPFSFSKVEEKAEEDEDKKATASA